MVWEWDGNSDEGSSGLVLGPEGLELSTWTHSLVLDTNTGTVTRDRGHSLFAMVVGVDGTETVFVGSREGDGAAVLSWVEGSSVTRQVETAGGESVRVSEGDVFVSDFGYASPSFLERMTHDGRSWRVSAEPIEPHPRHAPIFGSAVNVSEEIAVVPLYATYPFTFAGEAYQEIGSWLFGLDRHSGETRWFVHLGDGFGVTDFKVTSDGFEQLVRLGPGQQLSLGGNTFVGPEASPAEVRWNLLRIRGDASGTRFEVSEYASLSGFIELIVPDGDGYAFALNVPEDGWSRPRVGRLDGSGTITQQRDLYPVSPTLDRAHVYASRLAVDPDGSVYVAGGFHRQSVEPPLYANYVLKLRLD